MVYNEINESLLWVFSSSLSFSSDMISTDLGEFLVEIATRFSSSFMGDVGGYPDEGEFSTAGRGRVVDSGISGSSR